MKRIAAIFLALICLVSAVGCGSAASSGTTADTSSTVSETASGATTSVQTVSLATPQFDPAEVITARQLVPADAQTFDVDAVLRAEYFDYFAPGYAYLMPRTDFASTADITDDDMVRFAVKAADYLAYTPMTGLTILEYNAVQYACLKYLNTQISDLNAVTTYSFDPVNYHFIDSARFGAFYYYYRLEELSVDAAGVYTGVFRVYQKGFATPDDYDAFLDQARQDLTAGQPDETVYKPFSTVTLQFVKMQEEDGTVYYRYESLHTEKE